MVFSRSEGLADHRRIVHGYPKLKCKVEDCGAEFSENYNFRNHRRTHMRGLHPGDRPFVCNVTGCDKRYTGKIKLADHMRGVHGSPKLKCSSGQCTAEFVYKKHLVVHAKEHLI